MTANSPSRSRLLPWGFLLALVPLLLWLLLLVVFPQLNLFILSFFENVQGNLVFTLENYTSIFEGQGWTLTGVVVAIALRSLLMGAIALAILFGLSKKIPDAFADRWPLILEITGVVVGAIALQQVYRYIQASDFIFLKVFAKTILYTLITTGLALIVAYPMAYLLAKVFTGRQKLMMIVLLATPFWISELVRVYAWMGLLRETGVLNYLLVEVLGILSQPVEFLYNDIAMFVVFVYSFLLIMLLPIYSSLDGLDDTLIQAAQNLGAGWFSVFRYIVWPASLPGVTSGSILVFMLSISSYLIPTLIGGKDSLWVTQMIYNRFIVATNWNLGAAYGFILLVITSLMVWLMLRLTGQSFKKVFGE